MKRAVNLCVFASLVFMLLLMAVPYAGALGAAAYAVAYVMTFVIAAAGALLIAQRSGTEVRALPVKIDKRGAALTLPLVLPSIALIMLAAALTSYLLSLAGIAVTEVPRGNAVYVILIYAIIPALGEEMLFRYLPISLIAPYSGRGAILASALLFSAVHANPIQMPYAFLAGLVFAFIDIAADSILPSVAVHALNNLASLAVSFYAGSAALRTAAVIFAVLVALSMLVCAFKFKAYKEEFKKITSHGGGVFTAELVAFLCITLLIACISSFYNVSSVQSP